MLNLAVVREKERVETLPHSMLHMCNFCSVVQRETERKEGGNRDGEIKKRCKSYSRERKQIDNKERK